jgi:RNA polymerase sigma factor (sigma-70 family)
MRDSEVVASIVAGDPLGLAAAYDRYADPLFQYCRTLLSDPADAADAVQDAFVIAASRLDGLRDPSRLRPWLYAVARNEALRILRSKNRTSAPGEAPDVTDDSGDAAGQSGDAAGQSGAAADESERADLRALLEAAAAGLNPGEREVIELQLRQGLDTAEVATVLGVSRNHAQALIARAREQLETCLAVLLVGRAGRGECDELAAMLAGWDGRLTVLLRGRLHRHIGQCAACGARRTYELRPAMLLDLSPGAALAAGALTSLRQAAGAPDGLRAHTITLATGQEVGAVAHRAAVLSRAGAFTRSGFPKPTRGASAELAAHGGGAGRVRRTLRSSPRAATVTAAIVIAAIIAAAAFALTGNSRAAGPAADPSPPGVAAAPAAATSAASAGVSAAATKAKPTATPAATPATPTPSTATGPDTAATATAPTPSTATSPRTTATSANPPAPRSTAGTLSEYPRGGTLVLAPNGSPGRQLDLSGSGSGDWYVHWSLAVANDPGDVISVSSSAGTLTSADATAAVTVTASRFVPCGWPRTPTITVSPGGAVFTVCTSWPRSFTGGARARADDDAVYVSPPGREPDGHSPDRSGRAGVGGLHGSVL